MMANKRYMTVQVVIPNIHKVVEGLGVDERGEVQAHVTNEIFERLLPYLPLKFGSLRRSAAVAGTKHIVVASPYARAQFFGVTRTGKPFNYEPTGPKVGSHWDRRLKEDEGAAILADANKFVKGLR